MHTILRYIFLFVLFLGMNHLVFSQNKKQSKRAISKEIAPFSFDTDKDRKNFESQFFSAQLHKLDEDWEEEIVALEACLEITTQIPAIYFELAQAYKAQNNVEFTIENYKKALELDKDNIWFISNLADAYRSKFEYKEEYNLRKKLTEKFPESDQYRQSFIESLLLLSRHDEAIKEYNILERNFGIQPEYSYKKHQLYIAKQDWKSAEKELLKLIEEFPSENDFQLALAEFYIYIKDNDKAKNIYENILINSPKNGTAEYGLFQLHFQNKDYESAEKYLKSALQSGDLSTTDQLGIIEYAYSQYTNKLRSGENLHELLDISIALYPDQFEYYAYKGDLYPNTEYNKKVKFYKKAVQISPKFQLFNVIYDIYFINHDYDSAIAWTNKTIEQYEYRPEPYLIKAYSHFNLNQFEKTIEASQNGLEFIIDNNNGKIPYLSIIATSANSLKQYNKSDQAFDDILKIDPQNIQALNNYSYYLSERSEKLDLAEKMILIVIEKEPNSSTYLDTYGWIKYKLGEFDKATDILQKAVDLTSKPSAEMLEHLGDSYLKLNNKPEALKYWKLALSLINNSESSELKKKIKANE